MTDDAIQRLLADLQNATAMYRLNKREGAAAAVIVTVKFLREGIDANHLTAPLLEAFDVLCHNVELSDTYKARVAHIFGASIADHDRWRSLSKKHIDNVFGAVAVEFQILNGCSPEDAMQKVAGNDRAAQKSLAYFRHNIEYNDSPKGAWECFEWLVKELKEFPVSEAADLAVEIYQERIGKEVVKRSDFTKL